MDVPSRPPTDDTFLRRLLYRWFVQYNPLYLVSAMLVLGGIILTSRGLAREGSLYGPLGVAAIAEVYAAVLIGGAAMLTRIGQRRPAVMLALLTVAYQADLTLHTETCPFLGAVGVAAMIAWLGLFAVKLRALAWALHLRISRRTWATAMVGAGALALGPYAIAHATANQAGALVGLVVFAIGSVIDRGGVTSVVELDGWGGTVLRRSVRATWAMWATLLALHVLFWSTQHPINLAFVVPAAVLLAANRIRSEARVWMALGTGLVVAYVASPSSLALVAALGALVLARRALGRVATVTVSEPSADANPSPYRAAVDDDAGTPGRATPYPRLPAENVVFVPVDAAARVRLLLGALLHGYLAAWSFGWQGGAFPAHVLALDLGLALVVIVMAWQRKPARFALAPLAATLSHGLILSGLVPAPHSLFQWGAASVGIGFLLLLASLVTSYRLRHVRADGTLADAPPKL